MSKAVDAIIQEILKAHAEAKKEGKKETIVMIDSLSANGLALIKEFGLFHHGMAEVLKTLHNQRINATGELKRTIHTDVPGVTHKYEIRILS